MKRVLVTGATGFIGRHTLPLLLARDYAVHAISWPPQTTTGDPVAWHEVDLMDSSQVARLLARVEPTHLLHLAWYAVPGKYWTSPENLRWTQASLDLVRQFAQLGGQRVLMAGSCAEYDWRYGYCSEAVTPLAPATLYGTCKHALQLMLAAFARDAGLSAAWGRIFFLYGPYESPERLVPYVIRSLLKGEPARTSHGNQIRDFLCVQDIADALAALLDSPVTGPVNIASGQPLALKDLIFKIADRLDRRALVQLGAVPAAANEPPLLLADIRRLRGEVGWLPTYSLDAGLDLTLAWWKER